MDVRIILIFFSCVQAEVKIYYQDLDTDVIPEPRTVKIIEMFRLDFNCTSNNTNPLFAWLKDGKPLVFNKVFMIQQVTVTDDGEYTCQARYLHPNGSAVIEAKSLTLQILQPISAILTEGPLSVLHGEQVTITASATGYPEPSFEWRQDSTEGPLLSRNKTYQFTAINDFHLYCTARSLLTPTIGDIQTRISSKKFVINVHYKAEITDTTTRLNTLQPGETLDAKCYTTGYPDPDKWWTKQGDDSFSWQGYQLLIRNVAKRDEGVYVFNAQNTVLPANQSALTTHVTAEFRLVVENTDGSYSTTKSPCMPDDCSHFCTNGTMDNDTGSSVSTSDFTSEPSFAALIAILSIVTVALIVSIVFNIIFIRRQSVAKNNDTGVAKVVTPAFRRDPLPSPDVTPNDHHYTAPIPSYTDLDYYDQIPPTPPERPPTSTDRNNEIRMSQLSNSSYLHPTGTSST